nr:uncharacterized protein [Tanacetum cinerariifolium]
ADQNILKVGKELIKETIPLESGSRLYKLQGLRPNTWYEVKISYPASIPASFSLQLNKGDLNLPLKQLRKLLNTEKLIFKNDDAELENIKSGTYVMLTMEPEGVLAVSNGKERKMVIYNIGLYAVFGMARVFVCFNCIFERASMSLSFFLELLLVFLLATFDCLLKTYGFLTPDFWRETRFSRSPFQEYTDMLAKPTTKAITYVEDADIAA